MVSTCWKTACSITIVGFLSLSMAHSAVAQDPVPGLGTWTLNVAKSKYSPGPTPKSGTVTFSTAGQAVKARRSTGSTPRLSMASPHL